jgi:hypothetical protein
MDKPFDIFWFGEGGHNWKACHSLASIAVDRICDRPRNSRYAYFFSLVGYTGYVYAHKFEVSSIFRIAACNISGSTRNSW